MATVQNNGLTFRCDEILTGVWADERLKSTIREALNVGAIKVSK